MPFPLKDILLNASSVVGKKQKIKQKTNALRINNSPSGTTIISGLEGPRGLAFDNSGNLYVANLGNGTIGKYNSNGGTIDASFVTGLREPFGLAFDNSGNLYVSNSYYFGKIGKYNSNGGVLNANLVTGLTGPYGIAFDTSGNLYVATLFNSTIGKYDSNGGVLNANFITGLSGLDPVGIAFDNSGNLYVSKIGNNTIGKYDSNGGVLNANFITGLSGPFFLAFDNFGNLYVSNIDGTIGKYNSNGETIDANFITLTEPFGIAFDTSGNLYVSENGNDTVIKYSLTPTPITNTCFPKGTPITTDQGNILIEQLNPDIHTIRNKKIEGITKTITQDTHLVCFEKDALGKNIPSQKTIISKNHKVLYKGKMMAAKEFLVGFEEVKRVKYNGEILYNVLMEKHEKMAVNNLICETLDPENCLAKLHHQLKGMTIKEQNELINKLNKYAIENNVFSSTSTFKKSYNEVKAKTVNIYKN